MAPGPAWAAGNDLELVSRADGIAGAPIGASGGDMSNDGRYVVFASAGRIYRRDRQSNQTLLVSETGGSPSVTDDGRLVAFAADPGSADGPTQMFVRDVQAGTTTLVSRASGVNGTAADAFDGQISGDGSRVVFVSSSDALDPDDTDTLSDIFVRDLAANRTILVSRANGARGAKFFFGTDDPTISDNGDRVAFKTGLFNAEASPRPSIYVRDLSSDSSILVSSGNDETLPSISGEVTTSAMPLRRCGSFGT